MEDHNVRVKSFPTIDALLGYLRSDANERRLREALSVLEGYEKLEAELIMCNEVWDSASGLPQLPERFYERFIELQVRRNDVLGRIFKTGSTN